MRTQSINTISRYLLATRSIAAIFSGLLVAIPYNVPQLYLITWFGFVPILIALQGCRLRGAYVLGLLFGLSFYLSAASWISDFIDNFKDYSTTHTYVLSIVFWVYCAQLPALMFLLFRWLTQRSHCLSLLTFPVLTALFYGFFPMLFSVQLGESQSYFLAALQGIEFTGVFGLDFLIGLVNACFAALITQHYLKKVNPSDQWLIAGALAGFSLWLGYGMYAVPHWDTVINAQVKTSIAFIQPNEEPSASIPPAAPGFSKSYPPELAYTELLKADSPELIIIPETRYKGYFRYDHINSAFQRHVDNLNIPVIFQDNEQAYINNEPKKYNSAVLLNDNGKHSATYRKTKRVPFGEYLPLFDEWAPAKKWVVELFGDFFIDFSAGNEPTVFTAGQIKALPLICYEVMFSDFVANSVNAVPHSNVLITISNNGWFGETRQPYQHLNSSLLRSVETRLPMIHATNNGPSAVFLANGRRLLETPYHQSAAFVTQVPLATQPTPTLFTQHPYWFVYLCIAVLTTLIIFRIKIKK